ncbi:BTAD domain-containing putative transcriptional regulator [Pseudonocardia dioxanivorans]|nr:BTAD domain-containing putative transcriptional regulator [Pseudonocardia dioxanivorans]
MSSPPRIRLLGRLEVCSPEGAPVTLGGPRERSLLGLLALHPNRVLPAQWLVDTLWAERPGSGSRVTVRTHVSHLRRRLAAAGLPDVLVTRAPGYQLEIEPDDVDSSRFERLVRLGQEALGAGDAAAAATGLRTALGLWRGPLLADLEEPEFAADSAARLDELRLTALESCLAAELDLGRHLDVVAELEALVAHHPFRERLCGQLMVALYRCGRQTEALAAYAAARSRLADELGLDAGPELAALEAAILRQDPVLLPAHHHAPPVRRQDARTVVEPPPDALFAAARRLRLVGRDAELARLAALWRETCAGASPVVLLSGEAGVGKSRLAAELARLVADDGGRCLIGRCDPVAAAPYRPLAAIVRMCAQPAAPRAGEPAAGIEVLLDAPPGPAGGRPEPAAALRLLLAGTAHTNPTAVVVEDAEWIDPASADLLRALAADPPARLMLLICFRDPPGSRHEPLRALLGDGAAVAERVVLGPLAEPDVRRLAGEILGRAVPDGAAHRLWERSGGNPFFLTEIVRDLRDRREEPAVGPFRRIPTRIRDVLRDRVARLPPVAQHVVTAAAVVGGEVGFELLAALVDGSEDDLVDGIERAVDAGLLLPAGQGWGSSYAFRHGLIRDCVYDDVAGRHRERLHARAGRALLTDRNVAAAAVHLRAAGPAADAAEVAAVSLRAAELTGARAAWEDAVGHAEAAVAILARIDAPAEARADAAVGTAMLRIKSGRGHPEAIRHLEEAVGLYRAAGSDELLGAVHSRIGGALSTHHSVMDIPRALEHLAAAERLLAEPAAVFHLQRGLTQAAMYGMRTALLATAADRAGELARRLGRRDLGVLAGWARGWALFNRGELAAADACFEEVWAVAHELGDPFLGWAPVNAGALAATAYLLDPTRGRDWCRRGLAQPGFAGFADPHTAVLDQLALAQVEAGELAAARRTVGRLPAESVSRRLLAFRSGAVERAAHGWAAALRADEAAGDLHDAALNARWLAMAQLALGDRAGAAESLTKAVAWAVSAPQVPTELVARAELARVRVGAGDLGAARAQLDACDLILAGGADWRGAAGVVELARGAVAAAAGDRRRSDRSHRLAVESFVRYRTPWHRIEALRAWSRARRELGDPAGATGPAMAADELRARLTGRGSTG